MTFENMDREQLIELILDLTEEGLLLKDKLKTAQQTISEQEKIITGLRLQAKKYYQAASDYVPPIERDYD